MSTNTTIKPTDKMSESQVQMLVANGILKDTDVAKMRDDGMIKQPKVNENYTDEMKKIETSVRGIAYVSETSSQGRLFIGKDGQKYLARFYWRKVSNADSSKTSQ
jgi:hypothetical protein